MGFVPLPDQLHDINLLFASPRLPLHQLVLASTSVLLIDVICILETILFICPTAFGIDECVIRLEDDGREENSVDGKDIGPDLSELRKGRLFLFIQTIPESVSVLIAAFIAAFYKCEQLRLSQLVLSSDLFTHDASCHVIFQIRRLSWHAFLPSSPLCMFSCQQSIPSLTLTTSSS